MSRRTTIAIIRFLRPKGPRRKRMPRQKQPDLVRKEYYDAILPFVRQARPYWANIRSEIFRLLAQANAERKDARFDAVDPKSKRAKQLIDQMAKASVESIDTTQLSDLASRFGKRTGEFQRRELDRQVQAAFSVPMSVIERPVRDRIAGFAAENVDLIKTVHERYFDRIADRVQKAFETGMRPEDLAAQIQEIDDISERDALRIANDQIGKLNAQFNQARQEQLGISGYTWRTVNDNRVRDEHVLLDGQRFTWNSPPTEGHPGESINCRCYAEPDVEPLLEQVQS